MAQYLITSWERITPDFVGLAWVVFQGDWDDPTITTNFASG
jgi:hypothetical protein